METKNILLILTIIILICVVIGLAIQLQGTVKNLTGFPYFLCVFQ